MFKYNMTKSELDVITNLHSRFGDVSLAVLMENYELVDAVAPYNGVRIPTVEQACKKLTDVQIESLVQEPIKNLHFYTHYTLRGWKIGTNVANYNGHQVENLATVNTYTSQRMKADLESRIPDIRIVMNVIKTTNTKYTGLAKWIKNPRYNRRGLTGVGNIIFYDTATGKFGALNKWISFGEYNNARNASSNSIYGFATSVTLGTAVRDEILNAIRQQIQTR